MTVLDEGTVFGFGEFSLYPISHVGASSVLLVGYDLLWSPWWWSLLEPCILGPLWVLRLSSVIHS